jgi:alanyl-tRNA synthetase
MSLASSGIEDMMLKAMNINDIKVISARVTLDDPGKMKELGDHIKDKLGSGVAVLIAEINNKVSILTIVTKDLTERIQAGKIVSEVASIVGGRGGGRPDMAMAGGRDVTKIDEAVQKATKIVEDLLK